MTVGIPDLPETTSPNNTDELLLNNNGNPRRVKVERVLALTGLDANEIETRISQNEINISSLQNSLDNILTENNLTLNDLPGVIGPNQINDGPGSGLNADLLDGIQATGFATSSQGQLADSALQPEDLNPGSTLGDSLRNASNLTTGTLSVDRLPSQVALLSDIDNGGASVLDADLLDGQDGSYYLSASNLTGTVPLARLPTGSGSGLDADLLDGQQGSYYLNYNNFNNKPAINDSTITISGGGGLSGSRQITLNQSFNEAVVISHDNTSTQSSVNNSGSTVIQDVTLDGYGHVTGLNSKTLAASDVGALPTNGTAQNSLKLGGTNASSYGILSQNETVTSAWYFSGGLKTSSGISSNPSSDGQQGVAINANGTISASRDSGASAFFGTSLEVPSFGTVSIVRFNHANNFVGSIVTDGTSTALFENSDYRLKEDIEDLNKDEALTSIVNYRPRKYKIKGNETVGFIAHEFQDISPKSVSGQKDEVDENGKPIYQQISVANPKTIAELVKVCQYLISENEELKNRVEILENS